MVCCLLLGMHPGIAADEMDPFDVEGSGWVSLDRYSDRETRFPSAEEPKQEITSPQEMTVLPANAPTNMKTQDQQPEAPHVAQPIRPLNLPLMPGYNQGFEVRVSSTDEDMVDDADEEGEMGKPTRSLNLPVMPGVEQANNTRPSLNDDVEGENTASSLDEGRWKDAKAVAKRVAQEISQSVLVPFNVRLATLPDSSVTAAPGSPIIRQRKAALETAEAKPTVKQTQAEKSNLDACAALTAYRKKQLVAIESDRQTLNALQAAIAELGLDKKMDFMSGSGNALTALPKNEGPQSGMEMKSVDSQSIAGNASDTAQN